MLDCISSLIGIVVVHVLNKKRFLTSLILKMSCSIKIKTIKPKIINKDSSKIN